MRLNERITSIIGIIFVACTSVGSMKAQTTDSLQLNKSQVLDELVVTGARYGADVRHLSMTVSVMNRDKIEHQHTPSLLPMLTEHVPGLFITSRGMMGYGVSGGAAGSMNLRGMGGNSARLMVLVDGHPQYAGIMGHPVADVCQGMMAGKVEVLRGPASVLYGSNAMGGVINIVTRKMDKDGVETQANVGYGSYQTIQSEITNRIRKGKFTSVIGGSYNRTDGHQDNMEFRQYSGYVKLGYEWSSHWKTMADVNLMQFKASQPGAISAPLEDADQRITRGMASVSLDNTYEKTSGTLSLFYNWGRHKINDGYNAMEGESPLDYRFHSDDVMMGISWHQNFRLFAGNHTTIGADWYRFGGKAWNKFVSGEKQGEHKEIVDKNQNEIAGYVDFRQHLASWLTLNAGLRLDHHDQVGTEWIPQLGAAIHLPKNAEVKLSASKGFRYPIIREMFMWGVANPDLEAERIWNYEVSYSQRLLENRMQIGINFFYLKGDNMIMVAPVDGRMMNVNTGKIENNGVELQGTYRVSPHWIIDANYSCLHMKNPVISSPEHKFYGGVSYAKGAWNVSTGIQYVGGLYKSTAPEEKENYVLWNLKASYAISKHLSLWVRGENLLAQQYEMMSGYPMPKATFMGGVQVVF